MLNPFIIDQIKKREQEQRRRGDGNQPVLELPLPMPTAPHPTSEDDEGGERGIFIIDLF